MYEKRATVAPHFPKLPFLLQIFWTNFPQRLSFLGELTL